MATDAAIIREAQENTAAIRAARDEGDLTSEEANELKEAEITTALDRLGASST